MDLLLFQYPQPDRIVWALFSPISDKLEVIVSVSATGSNCLGKTLPVGSGGREKSFSIRNRIELFGRDGQSALFRTSLRFSIRNRIELFGPAAVTLSPDRQNWFQYPQPDRIVWAPTRLGHPTITNRVSVSATGSNCLGVLP